MGGTSEIYIYLVGATTAGCDLQNVIPDAGGAAVNQTAISSAERRAFFFSFFCAFVSQTKSVSPGAALPALICVHVQVELCAQVEVEKRVDAEDEEQDRHDDQEGVLQDRARHNLGFCSVRCLHTQEPLCFVGIVTGGGFF